MKRGAFEGIWKFGRTLTIFDPDSSDSRTFLGFLEPLSLTGYQRSIRKKAAVLFKEKFRLIAEPGEDFYSGRAVKIACGADEFEILTIKTLYMGEKTSHRECILLRIGEVAENA